MHKVLCSVWLHRADSIKMHIENDAPMVQRWNFFFNIWPFLLAAKLMIIWSHNLLVYILLILSKSFWYLKNTTSKQF